MENVQISSSGFVCEGKFRVENKAILKLLPRKLTFLLFSN